MREVYSFVQMVSRAIRFMLSEIGKGILNALIFFRVLFIDVKVNKKYSLNLLIPGIFITHTHTHTLLKNRMKCGLSKGYLLMFVEDFKLRQFVAVACFLSYCFEECKNLD